MKWRERTKHLGELLSGFSFNFDVSMLGPTVFNSNHQEEKQRWMNGLVKPVMKQYREHLAKASREQLDAKLERVEGKQIKSFAQLRMWERKIADVFEEANGLGQRMTAKNNIAMFRHILGAGLTKIELNDPDAKWRDIVNNYMSREIPVDILEEVSNLMQNLLNGDEREKEQIKKLLTILDLWCGHRGWYTQ